jgi:hypothetical protein
VDRIEGPVADGVRGQIVVLDPAADGSSAPTRARLEVGPTRAPQLVEPSAEGSSERGQVPAASPAIEGPAAQALSVSDTTADAMLAALDRAGLSPDGPGGDAFVFVFSAPGEFPGASDVDVPDAGIDAGIDVRADLLAAAFQSVAPPQPVGDSGVAVDDAASLSLPASDWLGFILDA